MAKKIVENWKEIERIEELVREQTGDPNAGFNANVFWFSKDGSDGRQFWIPVLYSTPGEGGDMVWEEEPVPAKFCPFTGKPLFEENSK